MAGEQLADIGQHRLAEVVSDGARRHRTAPEVDELLGESRVVDPARRQTRQVVAVARCP